MNNLRFLLCISLALCCNISYGNQQIYAFSADYYNVCNYSVRVVVRDFSQMRDYGRFVQRELQPEEKIEVLRMIAHSNSIDDAIASSYSLEIKHSEKVLNFNNLQFLELLKKLKDSGTCGKDGCYWTIKDPSLCP
jgi:hypothetical protein